MLISAGAAMVILLLLGLYGAWRYQHRNDEVHFEYREINPDVYPVEAAPVKHSSDTIEEIAEHAKEEAVLHTPPPVTNPPPQVPAAAQMVQVVPEQSYAPQPPENLQQDSQQVYEAPEPLQQRAVILDVENPIVQPPPEAMDVDIPTDISRPSEPTHDSDYGVRYSPDNPGRILRDKRYRRNAAND